MSEATGSPLKGVFGKSEIVQDGTIDGVPRMVMRPKSLPHVEIEVIDGCGNVDIQRTGHGDRYWKLQLEGQGGDPNERAAKGRMNANRIVVAVLSGPEGVQGRSPGERFENAQRLRRAHGYQISKDRRGRDYIEILDPSSEIAQRRANHLDQIREGRAQRIAEKMDTATAAASVVMRQGGMMPGAPYPAQASEMASLRQRLAQLEAAAAPHQPPATAPEADDDAPADRPTSRKGK